MKFMMPLQQLISQRIFAIAGISLAALLVAGLFLYQVNTQTLAHFKANTAVNTSAPGKAYLAPQTAPAAASTQAAPMREVHIANNGLVLLRGARVVSVSGSEIRAHIAWGASDFIWTVHTEYNTKFLTSDGKKETLEDIAIGDTITATGMLVAGGGGPVMNAEFVRE